MRPEGEGFAFEQKAFDMAAQEIERRRVEQSQIAEADFMQSAASLNLMQREELLSQDLPDDVRGKIESQQRGYITALGKDQVGLLRSQGADVPPLDPQDLMGSLQQRLGIVEGIAGQNNVRPVLTTPAERLQITQAFDEMPVTDKVDFVSQVAANPEVGIALFSEISDQAPFLAHAGELSVIGGDPDAVATAMQGYDAGLRGMSFTGDTPSVVASVSADASEALRGLPRAQGQLSEFALNYPRGLSVRSGGVVSPDHLEEGFEAGLGGRNSVRRYNGERYVLPMGVDNGTFRDWLDGVTDDEIAEMNGGEAPRDENGATISAEYIRDNGELLTLGNGFYGIDFDDGTSAVGTGPGGRFILRYAPRSEPE